MCGIVGYIGSFKLDFIDEMIKSVAHRGPDASGSFKFDGGAVGHTRLAIIDLDKSSNQPMFSKDNRYVIVFNGEIYNFKALKKELEEEGELFHTNGDTEVLLKLWGKKQAQCLNSLDGIFSFAVLDTHDQSITLVRDPYGVKPLYYYFSDQGFIFGSEIKAILQSNAVPRKINHDVLFRTLCFLYSPGQDTIIESVKKVGPGEIVKLKNNTLTSNYYYKEEKYIGDIDKAEALNLINRTIKHSVYDQLLADVKVGGFLSGGLDSSLICALAKKKSSDFKDVFSIKVNEKQNKIEGIESDLPFAKKVADILDLNLNIVDAHSGLLNYLPSVIFHLDEPLADPAILNTYLICKLAKEKGIKVLLSGTGGDDFFTGYRRHLAAKYGIWLDFVPNPIRLAIRKLSLFLPQRINLFRKLRKFLEYIDKDQNDRIIGLFAWANPNHILSLFSDQNLIIDKDAFSIFRAELEKEDLSPVEKCLRLEKKFFLADHNLNYTDKMSMAHGVEVRVPFITKSIADCASRIPTSLKQRFFQGKWILKKMAEKYLPKSIIYRKKTGFGVPLRVWLHGELAPFIDKYLSEYSIKKRGVFDYKAVSKMIYDDKNKIEDFSYTIYALIVFEIWCRQYIDNIIPQLTKH